MPASLDVSFGWGRAATLGAVAASAALVCLAAWRGDPATALLGAFSSSLMVVALFRASSGGRVGAAPIPRPELATTQELLAAFPEAVILVSERAVVLAANAAALAVAPGLRAGHPLSLALRAPSILDGIPRVLATGQGDVVEYRGRVATEPTFEVGLNRLDRADERGRPGVLLNFRDLTAQRRSERMRVDFVANVSHELRTPLATILGFVETLQGAARHDAGARDRFLEVMRGQANRMTRLIDDLLQLSRVEMKAHLPPSSALDLALTVASVAETMAPLARERDVTLALDVPSEPVLVIADRDEVLRLTENLVANAIKYGGRGGTVDVAVRPTEDDGTAELSVRDHGPGIAPEHLPRLTERFYRVDVAESRAQGGTGLGLAIVKHIVTRHRGRFLIESEPGRGATFRVRLPGAAGPTGEQAAPVT